MRAARYAKHSVPVLFYAACVLHQAPSLQTLTTTALCCCAVNLVHSIAAGALTLASPEVKFLMDHESQKPADVEMYQLREANAMVEEFMLLGLCAN